MPVDVTGDASVVAAAVAKIHDGLGRVDLVVTSAASAGHAADLVNISSIGAHVTFPNYVVYGGDQGGRHRAVLAARRHVRGVHRAEHVNLR